MPVVRRVRPNSRAQKRFLRALFLILLSILAFYFFFRSSIFNISQLEVRDNFYLTPGEIEQLANVPYGSNIFTLDSKVMEQNLLLHPMVKEVEISRKWPDTVVISVVEREPVLLVPSEQGFLALDATGVYLKKVSTISDVGLPLVTGLEVPDNVGPGQVIKDEKLAQALEFLSKTPEDKRHLIMELEVKDNNQYCVYTHEGIEVRFGLAAEVEEKFEILAQILKSGELNWQKVKYIDLNTPHIPVIKYQK